MLNSHRQTSTPTSAISPATTAVAAPPDHNMRASTLGRNRRGGPYAGSFGEYGRLSGVLGDIGTVMVSQAFRQAGRFFRSLVLSSPPDCNPNTVGVLLSRVADQPSRRMTSSVRGPCTPWTLSSSMSLVAEGPLIQVHGRRGSSRPRASGTIATIWLAQNAQVVVG